MRIDRLLLERFGHFSGAELDLSASGARLTIVFGDNEAGKSTALRAIGDALFGIDARTPYAFRHGYDGLRIGAEISGANGRRLAFRRRKGTKNTLLDLTEKALAETALAPFLGGATRSLFDGLFGLDQQALRIGGQEMLSAQGDLGQTLFEAGSHIRGLSSARRDFEDAAGDLYTPRASTRRFNEVINAYQDTRRQVEARTVRADEWARNAAALEAAETDSADVRARRDQIERQRARAERTQRLLPHVANLRRAEAEYAGLADAPDMPADAEQRLNQALRQIAVATNQLDRAEADADRARGEIEGIEVPTTLLARSAEIRELPEKLGEVRKDAADLPKRRAERADALSRLGDLARRLGLDLSPEQASSSIPTDAAMAELRRLTTDHAKLDQAEQDARARLDEARQQLEELTDALAAAPAAPDTGALSRALDAAKARPDLPERRDGLVRDAEAARRKLGDRLSALPCWSGDAAALAASPVPDRATVQRFEAAFAQAERVLDQAEDKRAEAAMAVAETEDSLAALQEQGLVPTAEAVAEARAHRDRGWRLIRRAHLDGQAVPPAEIAAFAGDAGLGPAYDQAVRDADAIGDRRADEARRVEAHAQLVRQRGREAERLGKAEASHAGAEAALEALRAEWNAAWKPSGIEPLPPREMEAWLAERARALDEADAITALDRDAQAIGAAIDDLAAALRAALAGLVPEKQIEARFPLLVAQADAILSDAAGRRQRRTDLTGKRDDQARIAAREEAALGRAEVKMAEWRAAWSAAIAAVRLPAETSSAAADAALALWQDVRRVSDALETLNHRIRRMEEDTAAFGAFVRDLAAEIAPDLVGASPADAASVLPGRLREAQEFARRKGEAGERLTAARKEAEQAQADIDAARAVLGLLRRQAGCETDAGIPEAIRSAARKTALTADIGRLKTTIIEAAEGLSLDAAIDEAEAAEPEGIQAEIARLRAANAALLAESQEIGQRLNACKAAQAEMEQGRGAADAAQDMAGALVDLEDCVRRWMVLRTASFLLGRGIDRFREEQQGPLLRRASELFALLTRGSFSGLQTSYDTKDQPVLLGVRADDAACRIDGMSEGTRDQLFLALRLAAVELYVGASEPLPFVADDLFVNFDDTRAEAGLDALMALGGSTQVLLFTHHRHIVELALARRPDGSVAVQRLAA